MAIRPIVSGLGERLISSPAPPGELGADDVNGSEDFLSGRGEGARRKGGAWDAVVDEDVDDRV
jgi:hypothetical protein